MIPGIFLWGYYVETPCMLYERLDRIFVTCARRPLARPPTLLSSCPVRFHRIFHSVSSPLKRRTRPISQTLPVRQNTWRLFIAIEIFFRRFIFMWNCYSLKYKQFCSSQDLSRIVAINMSDHITELKNIATQLRIDSVTSTAKAKSGHPTSCSSMAECMAVLFFDVMR